MEEVTKHLADVVEDRCAIGKRERQPTLKQEAQIAFGVHFCTQHLVIKIVATSSLVITSFNGPTSDLGRHSITHRLVVPSSSPFTDHTTDRRSNMLSGIDNGLPKL